MSKSKKTENLKVETKIFQKWTAAASIIDKLVEAVRADVFRGLKYLVAEKISIACGNDEALSSYDTEIYEAYMRIIDTYRQVVEIYLDTERPINSPAVKEIWDGIYEVLMSRLLAISERDSFANPVQIEKKDIVRKIISAASEQMDNITKQIEANSTQNENFAVRRWLLGIDDISFEDVQEVCTEIANNAKNRCLRDFYGTYISAVKLALVNLNDLSERHNVSYYNELLKEEQDLLRQIVVVQVMALEKVNSEGFATEVEAEIIEEALNVLRETHQRESSEIDRIEKLFNESAANFRENMGQVVMNVEDEEDFAASFDGVAPFGKDLPTIFETMKQSFAKEQSAFIEVVEDFATTKLTEYAKKQEKQEAYFSKKAVSALVMMAGDVTRCFAGILEYHDSNSENLANCDEKDIIKGVVETILIKIDSLNEAVGVFEEGTDAFFASVPQGKVTIDPETIVTFLAYMVENLLPFGKEEKNGAKIVKQLADATAKHRDFSDYRQSLEKSSSKRSEGIEKKMMSFMRDSFFYELSTFEEIMYYSVSRLRESGDEHVIAFVEEIDNQYKQTADILTKYGVEKIVPQAHDVFNPKENEVLMAEESEGFKKGEIIKTINSGYRQGDVIIMRANVIAAR
ncbi:MAG: nucleotide exchange factor GrpE [Defluviitaleaceae bacterium]|nr:nucleotide exchange factor GrpE [Defluviitaleaceae bacterium]